MGAVEVVVVDVAAVAVEAGVVSKLGPSKTRPVDYGSRCGSLERVSAGSVALPAMGARRAKFPRVARSARGVASWATSHQAARPISDVCSC